MGKVYQLNTSRENWKDKAIGRGNTIRAQNREIKKLKKDNKKIKDELENKKISEASVNQNLLQKVGDEKAQTFYLILLLFLFGGIGFRAISRVLEILATFLNLGRAPCVQTCVNVVMKFSIAKMLTVKRIVTEKNPSDLFSNGWIWLIDTSIALSTGKILVVLALPGNFHQLNPKQAPKLSDLYAVGVAVSHSWTGEAVANFLKQIISVIGRPLAFLKDGGTDLSKASKILGDDHIPILNISDISHAIANILKHYYKNHRLINVFLSACGKASSNFKQSILACLTPPTIKTKARFMNIILLVKWAHQILEHSPVGRAVEGSVVQKLRSFVGTLPECRVFIDSFLADAMPLMECQKILKQNGLTQDTYKECLNLINDAPTAGVRLEMTDWLNNQLILAENLQLLNMGLPISSDPIESLFGKAKIHGTGPIKDPNRIALRIPALCGNITPEDIQRAMDISTAELTEATASLQTLTKLRREHLTNPGSIEKLAEVDLNQHIQLIAGLKPGLKCAIKLDISTKSKNKNGPNILENNQEQKLA